MAILRKAGSFAVVEVSIVLPGAILFFTGWLEAFDQFAPHSVSEKTLANGPSTKSLICWDEIVETRGEDWLNPNPSGGAEEKAASTAFFASDGDLEK